MKALIVYANPKPESLSARVKDVVKENLTANGHEVVIRDLYSLKFNPVLTSEELENNKKGIRPDDILTEQKYVADADILFFIYPIWWTGLPAIVKGYIDRVLLYGFAYAFDANGLVKMLTGKKAVILNNHGLPKSLYDQGMYDALRLTSDEGIMRFCGIEVLEHKFFASATSVGEGEKEAYLASVKDFVASLK